MRETLQESKASLEREAMHAQYIKGGAEKQPAPHVIYSDAACPHPGCNRGLHAIDFRLEFHGRDVHDALVKSWWADEGFAGRCPECHGWIHFTIRAKQAVTEEEAAKFPQLPDNWHEVAVLL